MTRRLNLLTASWQVKITSILKTKTILSIDWIKSKRRNEKLGSLLTMIKTQEVGQDRHDLHNQPIVVCCEKINSGSTTPCWIRKPWRDSRVRWWISEKILPICAILSMSGLILESSTQISRTMTLMIRLIMKMANSSSKDTKYISFCLQTSSLYHQTFLFSN